MKSLHKVLDIIETVSGLGHVGIRELSGKTGFPPPTIHRILTTLVERGYLKQDPISKNYALSFRFLELGTKVQQQFNLTSIARPHLERLMIETRESVNLAVQDGDHVVYLDSAHSSYSMLQLFTQPGARVPLYATGVGKVFLSLWDEKDVHDYLKRTDRIRFTSRTLIEPEGLLSELARIRDQGYAVDDEEMEDGVRCVAAPVRDHNAVNTAAVSISGTTVRMMRDRIDELGQKVKICAGAISKEMGYRWDLDRPSEEVPG
jgi:IclR family acetate operon transcriptional repressor